MPQARASFGAARYAWSSKPAWYALRRTTPAPTELQGVAVARLTQPSDRIFVWGWSPGTYRYACRLPASRFTTLEKVGQVRPHADFIFAAAARDVMAANPPVMVMAASEYEGTLRGEQRDLAAWLAANYEIQDTVAGMHILMRQ